MTKLTEAQRRNLALLCDDWLTIYDIASKHPSGFNGVSGIANACAQLAKAGLAEWTVRAELSCYRITPAGRAALNEAAK